MRYHIVVSDKQGGYRKILLACNNIRIAVSAATEHDMCRHYIVYKNMTVGIWDTQTGKFYETTKRCDEQWYTDGWIFRTTRHYPMKFGNELWVSERDWSFDL